MDKEENDIKVIGEEKDNNKCLNKNFYSSMLFIVPTIYAYSISPPLYDIVIGSFVCFITSIINHYYKAENRLIQNIDRVVVISIAVYFTLQCLFKIGFTFYANIMYFLAGSAIIVYLYLHYNPHLYCDYHCLIHILAISGIMFLIKARCSALIIFNPVQNIEHSSISGSRSESPYLCNITRY
jgi:hypothetical protein